MHAAAADGARRQLRHHFVPGSDGPQLQLPEAQTDQQLRHALQPYDHVRLLRVSLTEARQLLRCYEQPRAAEEARQLMNLVFQHEWCYRPVEMTPEWIAVDRRGKPRRGTEPWCVWGFKTPKPSPSCDAVAA